MARRRTATSEPGVEQRPPINAGLIFAAAIVVLIVAATAVLIITGDKREDAAAPTPSAPAVTSAPEPDPALLAPSTPSPATTVPDEPATTVAAANAPTVVDGVPGGFAPTVDGAVAAAVTWTELGTLYPSSARPPALSSVFSSRDVERPSSDDMWSGATVLAAKPNIVEGVGGRIDLMAFSTLDFEHEQLVEARWFIWQVDVSWSAEAQDWRITAWAWSEVGAETSRAAWVGYRFVTSHGVGLAGPVVDLGH